MERVSLVIPGRNCAATVRSCLAAVVSILEEQASPLDEIIFVDDGSTDGTAAIVREFPVTCLAGGGRGPAAARNLGWRTARNRLVWFVDSDCVAEPGALSPLVPHFADPRVVGVGGTYANANPHSLLACLIHEEIRERHRRMQRSVNFLATFNVAYRRDMLVALNGFDERYRKAQDAEFAMRVIEAGRALHFEPTSRVAHFHETKWLEYLRTQRQQGFWRVWLHMEHRGHAVRDSYSSFVDHAQPPIAVALMASAPAFFHAQLRWGPTLLALLLLGLQIPMTCRMIRGAQSVRYLGFAVLSAVRAFWRGIGMAEGVFSYVAAKVGRVTHEAT